MSAVPAIDYEPAEETNAKAALPFSRRHIGLTPRDRAAMLEAVGASSIESFIAETVPAPIRQAQPLPFGDGLSEQEALEKIRGIAAKNTVYTSLIGQGYHGTQLPPVIQRNILENPAWYTAYTPYQPEISQGRLEALVNFQTMMTDLTGLDIANASLLDEATAGAEAMSVAKRASKVKTNTFFVDENIHPQTLAVIRTRAEPLGWEIKVGDAETDLVADSVFGAIFQYPGTLGHVTDFSNVIAKLNEAGSIAIMAADPMALTMVKAPGDLGADIAVGSTQRFGVPMGYGGPHAAYMAVRDKLKRLLPGRLVGVSVDMRGNKAYRLALQTREQHIRREKATSNICTAQVLLAVIASMYGVYHGPEGVKAIAEGIHEKAGRLAACLDDAGFERVNDTFFDTITVNVGARQHEILEAARAKQINFRAVGSELIGIAVDETTTPATLNMVLEIFGASSDGHSQPVLGIPQALERVSQFMTHPVFHMHRSETDILRYMRKLADRDLALDRAMIPLGSCTMKLNATAEMIPVTWPEFGGVHPFAPTDQAKGYQELADTLSEWLCDITGYAAMSLQPNSGAQGEYAGLLAIRGYHRARGEGHRNICLIPSSAHGTNPASAQMAGMEVVVVKCDEEGNVDFADLKDKAEKHSDNLAALMVTYPSTHGVFETEIKAICALVHEHGGQVYLDGANLNAQVGVARPGDYGADVSHLNLHKTFCIPHGGGGPGVGPIGVGAHLAPFLPSSPIEPLGEDGVGPVSAAPLGSASILPISWMYIVMMGADGLREATEAAILSANYIAVRVDSSFKVLFKNEHGRVAHECIIDPRPFKDSAGITVDDVAKRLIDFGFHAPTMSWPVAGTLMIEPTESESKRELDRFIDALIAIREEIGEIEEGTLDIANNPMKLAPHTVHDIADDGWDRPYTRMRGCFPEGSPINDKYWPSANRIDNAYGDRNLVCTCPPLDEYTEEEAKEDA